MEQEERMEQQQGDPLKKKKGGLGTDGTAKGVGTGGTGKSIRQVNKATCSIVALCI